MKDKKGAQEWLVRAESNFAIAKIGRVSKKIVYDDLCFECHQTVEKSLKALLVFVGGKVEHTHSITRLFELLKDEAIDIPEVLSPAKYLTPYASKSRYPGSDDPATSTDYKTALFVADKILKWTKSIINKKSNKLF